MQETEVKILEIDKRKIEEKLNELEAEKTFDGKIETLFFDFKNNSIHQTGNLLRIRKDSEKTELTYKEVKHNQTAKVAQEYSVKLSDLNAAVQILDKIGLIVTQKMNKQRTSYKIDEVKFDIDQYLNDFSFIPAFIEIEAENIEQIHKYAELLGFKPQSCLSWSTDDLIRHYSSKKKSE